MNYTGIIKGSRTLDALGLQGIIDILLTTMLLYTPEQLHITVPIFFAIRMGFTALLAYLRFQTTTPVGEKNV